MKKITKAITSVIVGTISNLFGVFLLLTWFSIKDPLITPVFRVCSAKFYDTHFIGWAITTHPFAWGMLLLAILTFVDGIFFYALAIIYSEREEK